MEKTNPKKSKNKYKLRVQYRPKGTPSQKQRNLLQTFKMARLAIALLCVSAAAAAMTTFPKVEDAVLVGDETLTFLSSTLG